MESVALVGVYRDSAEQFGATLAGILSVPTSDILVTAQRLSTNVTYGVKFVGGLAGVDIPEIEWLMVDADEDGVDDLLIPNADASAEVRVPSMSLTTIGTLMAGDDTPQRRAGPMAASAWRARGRLVQDAPQRRQEILLGERLADERPAWREAHRHRIMLRRVARHEHHGKGRVQHGHQLRP